MIDHIAIAVSDLQRSTRFYTVLGAIGMVKSRDWPSSIGFGKTYPEFWLNHRSGLTPIVADSGAHVCLRAREARAVDAFHAAALRAGGSCDGAPGLRPEYSENYYAAFIRDPDGNRIEVVTFL